MKSLVKYIVIVFVVLIVLSGLLAFFQSPLAAKKAEISLSTLVSQINAAEVKEIIVRGEVLEITLKQDDAKETSKREPNASLSESLINLGADKVKLAQVNIDVKGETGLAYYASSFLPILLPFIFFILIFWFLFRQAQRGAMTAFTFGKSKAKLAGDGADSKKKITFKDVAGLVEAKEEVSEVVEFLRDPRKFQKLGARMPRGVLLVGAPGTGKTLLAKAVANEAGVPFYYVSGSEFVEMFVGVGASRVRDVFETAKKTAPSIIFIDEIDAIGRHRGAGLGGGHDEREQTLNQILVEMDGFGTDDAVVVAAASVTGDTPVLVKKAGEVKLLPIKEAVDSYYRPGEGDGEKASPDIEVLGFERKNVSPNQNGRSYFGHSFFQPVRSVFRHWVKEIYEINYLGGVVRATGNHSVFTRNQFGIKATPVSQLKPGDCLVDIPFVVNRNHRGRRASRSHGFEETFRLQLPVYEPVFADAQPIRMAYQFALANQGLLSQSAMAANFGLSQTVISHWQNGLNIPRQLSRGYFKHPLPEKVSVTPELARLLGYYAAEGYARKEVDFCFNIKETEKINDVKALMKSIFNLVPDRELVRGNAINIIYYAKPLAKFFEKYCGLGAHYKHIPTWLFEAPRQYFLEFLRGYAAGDGHFDKRGRLEITSVSRQIIRELNWLCRMHGYKSYINSFTAKAGRVINGGKPLPELVAWRLGFGTSQNPFSAKTKPGWGTKRPVIKSIQKLPFDDYVYDFCGCDNEAFFGGESPLLLHNTNRPDILDPALLRPGRFDRRIMLDEPSINDREAILRIHAADKPLAKGVNLRVVAERTPGFSGADLANLLNEAAILAARQNQKEIIQENLFQAIEKVILGPERRSHVLSKKEKEIAAYHEAGHALLAASLPHTDPVHKVSIVSRGRAGGYTLKLPLEDKHLRSRSEFESELAVLLGGYTAEKLTFNELTTGASNDLKIASELARKMVTQYGMSDKVGPITFGEKEELVFLGKELNTDRNYSEATAKLIDSEIRRFITLGLKKAKEVLAKKINTLEKIAKELIAKETLEQKEFYALLGA